jgi:hypothetical protein
MKTMKELKPVNVTTTPEVLRLAREVARTKVPMMLKTDQEDLAELRPVSPTRKRPRRSQPTSENDPLWDIVGIAHAADFPDVPRDVARNKHTYLAEAYDNKA